MAVRITATCEHCGGRFTHEPDQRPAPTHCGKTPCHQIGTWTAAEWANAARLERIRLDHGGYDLEITHDDGTTTADHRGDTPSVLGTEALRRSPHHQEDAA